MIEILASVCLINEPEKCKDVHLSFVTEASAITTQDCFFMGQAELAKWSEGHPNWRISRWSCGEAKQVAKI